MYRYHVYHQLPSTAAVHGVEDQGEDSNQLCVFPKGHGLLTCVSMEKRLLIQESFGLTSLWEITCTHLELMHAVSNEHQEIEEPE